MSPPLHLRSALRSYKGVHLCIHAALFCSIGSNATRAHGRCQQAFLDAATQQNLTFLVQVRACF